MIITKLGHCCLLLEDRGVRILTDPGIFTMEAQSVLKNLDYVIITHEHPDHFHLESVKVLCANNPNLKIISNSSVGKLLLGIDYIRVEDGEKYNMENILIEGLGNIHAEIYDPDIPRVQNTGFMVNGRFYFPGDALHDPKRPVEILALPVAGPWLNIKQAIDFAILINPKKCFPVHDGILSYPLPFHYAPEKVLGSRGIEVILPKKEEKMNFG